MATSGTYTFSPDYGEIFDDAWERIGNDPADAQFRHLISARRSLGFIQIEWVNAGLRLFAIDRQTLAFTEDDVDYDLDPETLDITDAVLRRISSGTDTVDTPVYRISREEYLDIHDKSISGRPDRFYVEKRRETTAAGPELFVWQAPDRSTDILVYYRLRRLEDAAEFHEDPEIPYRFIEAMTTGLAMRLAEKYKPERFQEKMGLYNTAFALAKNQDRERASTYFTVNLTRRSRR